MALLTGKLEIVAVSGHNLPDIRFMSSMNPAVTVSLGGVRHASNDHRGGGKNPRWNQSLGSWELTNTNPQLIVQVDVTDGADPVASAQIPLDKLLLAAGEARQVQSGDKAVHWPVLDAKNHRHHGEIVMQVTFTPSAAPAAAAPAAAAAMPVAQPVAQQQQQQQHPQQQQQQHQQQPPQQYQQHQQQQPMQQPMQQPPQMQQQGYQQQQQYPMQPQQPQHQQQGYMQPNGSPQPPPYQQNAYAPPQQGAGYQQHPPQQPYQQQQQQGAGFYPQQSQHPPQQPMLSPPTQILYAAAPPQTYPANQMYSSPVYAPAPLPIHAAPAPYYPQQQGLMAVSPQPYYNGPQQPGTHITSAPHIQQQPHMQHPPQQMMMAPAPSVPASSSSPPGVWNPTASSDDGVFPFSELTIHRVIGDGTFGTVSAGEFRSTPVAIKTLKQTVFTPAQWDEFMSEVKFLREARHPNIVLFMGVSFNPYCIVTELLDTSLFNVLHVKHQRLTPKEQHHIALCIARGLASLHGHAIPIVHRDMKSLNILVSNDLTIVKICDLGMVKLKAAQGQRLESNGTPLWMAPEVLLDQPYDEQADVYSYGCILYEIVTGTLPFGGGNIPKSDLVERVGRRGERPTLPPGMAKPFRDLLVKCWQTHPQSRPTMKQVVAELTNMKV